METAIPEVLRRDFAACLELLRRFNPIAGAVAITLARCSISRTRRSRIGFRRPDSPTGSAPRFRSSIGTSRVKYGVLIYRSRLPGGAANQAGSWRWAKGRSRHPAGLAILLG